MNKKRIIIIALLLLILLAGWFVVSRPDSSAQISELAQEAAQQSSGESEQVGTELKMFTGVEFKQLYDNLSLPNTVPIVEAPAITDNKVVDEHIQVLAEKRGYTLRLVASSQLNTYQGHKLQVLLTEDWKELQKAAKNDGIELQLVSGYRSVAAQKQLFLRNYYALGLNTQQVISGQADETINRLLSTVAPPGYSRHHSGYTVDIADISASVFAYSAGYQWISANNYENAKRYGFIPSYPKGVANQGPEPEEWEYVWANREFVVE